MTDNWSGAVAIITGASRGIGRAVAVAAHARGARVGLVARSVTDLESLVDQLGAGAAYAVADVGVRAEVEDAVGSIVSTLGTPSILVNNAGIGSYASFLEEDAATFERMMRVNYLGTVWTTRAVLPAMVQAGHGHVVNVASIAGRLGAPFESAYSGSKFAVVGLTESLAAEVAGSGVRVSSVEPGPVATSFTETRGVPFQQRTPRPISPEVVAEAVVGAVDRDRFERVLPRWLALPTVVRAVAPGAYRSGLVRSFRRQSAELTRRFRRP